MEKKNYDISELFKRLMDDESWEEDPNTRKRVAASMYNSFFNVPLK